MEKAVDLSTLKLDPSANNQIYQCLNVIQEIFEQDLLAVYLYGSSVLKDLQKYSDIDLFVVSNRATTHDEKIKLVTALLKISSLEIKEGKRPIEMTIIQKSDINPWRYPPKFDFQYGEWLRAQFEHDVDPWQTKEMPDLALLITQILQASHTLTGAKPDQLLCQVPYKDFMKAITDALTNLMSDLDYDTRNVLLTLMRIWHTVSTDMICSKPMAADWAIGHLPENYHPVIERAKAIYKGEQPEYWDDLKDLIKPCADFILSKINNKMTKIMVSDNLNRSIKIS